jgi:phosphatidylethanolamine-binding protein (PEBP) family uncharacterized protein
MPLLSLMFAFELLSTTFQPNATMPVSVASKDCGGQNISPQLHWSGAPKGTKSFALIVHDPDAPRPGGFYHWVVQSIPSSASSIDAGTTRFAGYDGPCPPPGKVHHYNFTLYALDQTLDESQAADAAQLLQHIKGHILGQATLTGLYKT